MPITEGELERAVLNRTEPALAKLAESIDLVEKGGQIFLESSLPGIVKPKVVPSGDGVRQFIGRTTRQPGELKGQSAAAMDVGDRNTRRVDTFPVPGDTFDIG